MNQESAPEPIISEWQGLRVNEPVENPSYGWSGTLLRLYKNPKGEMIAVVKVRSGGEEHEMEEFAKSLRPIESD